MQKYLSKEDQLAFILIVFQHASIKAVTQNINMKEYVMKFTGWKEDVYNLYLNYYVDYISKLVGVAEQIATIFNEENNALLN